MAAIAFEGVANLVKYADIDRMRGWLAAFEQDEVLGVDLALAGNIHAV